MLLPVVLNSQGLPSFSLGLTSNCRGNGEAHAPPSLRTPAAEPKSIGLGLGLDLATCREASPPPGGLRGPLPPAPQEAIFSSRLGDGLSLKSGALPAYHLLPPVTSDAHHLPAVASCAWASVICIAFSTTSLTVHSPACLSASWARRAPPNDAGIVMGCYVGAVERQCILFCRWDNVPATKHLSSAIQE